MFYFRLAYTAMRSLDAHFLRSLLATLGVLIGVGSVVACMSILEGMSNSVIENFQNLGSNVLYVQPTSANVGGRQVGRAQTLTPESADVLLRELPDDVVAVSGEAIGSATVKRFQKSDTFSIMAASENYFEIHRLEADSGRLVTRADANDEMAMVCVLGDKVAEKLFGGMEPVGQPVKIADIAYRVIGVLEKRGQVGFLNADETVFIPMKAGLKRFFNRKYFDFMTVAAREGVDLEELQKRVATVLRKDHRIRPGEQDDFRIFTQEEILRQVNQFTLIFKIVFYSIAGISLVVGGIGIMNIMLVSVTERTREIGVRMAVGARRSDILLQFLIESLIISLLGGGFGLLLGAMFSDLLDKVLQGMFRTEISTYIVLTALITTTVVGVISGLYPAYKASRLDPVEALRYE